MVGHSFSGVYTLQKCFERWFLIDIIFEIYEFKWKSNIATAWYLAASGGYRTRNQWLLDQVSCVQQVREDNCLSEMILQNPDVFSINGIHVIIMNNATGNCVVVFYSIKFLFLFLFPDSSKFHSFGIYGIQQLLRDLYLCNSLYSPFVSQIPKAKQQLTNNCAQ